MTPAAADAHTVPPMLNPLEPVRLPFNPTAPPLPPGMYGPVALLNASVVNKLLATTLRQEQSAHRNVRCARLPAHTGWPGTGTSIGGAPVLEGGGGGRSTAGARQRPAARPPAPRGGGAPRARALSVSRAV